MGFVYKIYNKENGKVYIGSTKRLCAKIRWIQHKSKLKKGYHANKNLQEDWDKYGQEVFEFIVLSEVLNNDILKEEQKFLDIRRNNFPENMNYNIYWIAGSARGRVVPKSQIEESTRKRMSWYTHSQETINKQVQIWDNKLNKKHTLISPDGVTYEFYNANKFAREHNMRLNAIHPLLNGKINDYHGWTRIDSKIYNFISPDGVIYKRIVNLSKFGREIGVDPSGLSKVQLGVHKQ